MAPSSPRHAAELVSGGAVEPRSAGSLPLPAALLPARRAPLPGRRDAGRCSRWDRELEGKGLIDPRQGLCLKENRGCQEATSVLPWTLRHSQARQVRSSRPAAQTREHGTETPRQHHRPRFCMGTPPSPWHDEGRFGGQVSITFGTRPVSAHPPSTARCSALH